MRRWLRGSAELALNPEAGHPVRAGGGMTGWQIYFAVHYGPLSESVARETQLFSQKETRTNS
ncbi:MAG: hypothetical protein ACI8UO_003545 [Verrucomicrobiales bacterium]|jgi:hypothetical protein